LIGGGRITSRRKNTLDSNELAVMRRETKSYVEIFKDAISLFLKDCEIRNLIHHIMKFYHSELNTFLNYLREQGIDPSALKLNHVTEDY
jgi:integrase/recombinase XerD